MSVTANLTTNVETITATIVVEDETIIVQVSAAARGPAGEAGAAGAAGPNEITTATTTNLTGFISGNGTNISGATAAASAATPSTLVLRDANGGASFGAVNVTALTASGITTDGQIEFNGTDAGDSLTFNMVNYLYGAGAASAHRTALGLGTGDSPTFAGVILPDSGAVASGVNSRIRFGIGSSAGVGVGFASPVPNVAMVVRSWGNGVAALGLYGFNTLGQTAPLLDLWGNSAFVGAQSNVSLGIGTTTPTERLDVVGNIKASDTISAYGTYTDTSNYRRLALKMSSAGVAQIVAEGAGSGAAGNRLEFVTGGTTRMTVAADGDITTSGSITGTGALTLAAGGSNQNINLTPSGTGTVSTGSTVVITKSGTAGFNIRNTGATFTNSVAVGGLGNINLYANWDAITNSQSDTSKVSLAVRLRPDTDSWQFVRVAAGAGATETIPFSVSGTGAVNSLYQRVGSGTPEGVVTAPVGAVFHRTDGGAGTSFYVKESGAGNTGWVAK
jgi:hypothetical protein